MNTLRIAKIIINNLGFLALFPLRLFIKKANIVILESSSHHRYAGNPKYLYEYLSLNTDYDVYWLTESEDIKQYLDSKRFKYLSNKKIIHKIYIILKSRVIVCSGTSFHNPFYLVSRDRGITKICTMHGSGPKLTIARKYNINHSLSIIKGINSFDYVSFCTEYASVVVGINQLFLSRERIRLLGAPKSDPLFRSNYVEKCYKERSILKNIIGDRINSETCVIYYVPTFRPYVSELPIKLLVDFDEQVFFDFLKREDVYFIYSDHPKSSFSNSFNENERIIKIEFDQSPLFDNILLMMEVDMLIGDYSTLSTDFAILRRPQIFIMPDYEKNFLTKGFAEDLRLTLPGKEVENFSELCDSIKIYIRNPTLFNKNFSDKIDSLLDKYVDVTKTQSRKKMTQFISTIIENSR
jgi:CDP-glycerol glycerophosphotransferase (TagB/SpsB family)